jgi:hypothetical protein
MPALVCSELSFLNVLSSPHTLLSSGIWGPSKILFGLQSPVKSEGILGASQSSLTSLYNTACVFGDAYQPLNCFLRMSCWEPTSTQIQAAFGVFSSSQEQVFCQEELA